VAIIPELGKQRQEDQEFKASMGYLSRLPSQKPEQQQQKLIECNLFSKFASLIRQW
jgi:hypothetical protein